MEKKFLTVLALTLFPGVLLAAASSGANTSATSPVTATSFASLDVNKDNALSKDEVQGIPAIANNFDEIDFNGDGKIIEPDYYALVAALEAGRAPALPEYSTLDVNKDGTVEAAEYDAFKSRLADLDKLMLSGKLGSAGAAQGTTGNRGTSVQGASSDPELAPSSSTSSSATSTRPPATP